MNLHDKCSAFVQEIADSCAVTDTDELNSVRKNVLTFINVAFNEKIGAQPEKLSYIAANSASVEIIDSETGLCFRRELPFRYEETGNGVSLIGEDIAGNPSQISFLSEAAYEKIKDLTGKGPNAPVCGGHE